MTYSERESNCRLQRPFQRWANENLVFGRNESPGGLPFVEVSFVTALFEATNILSAARRGVSRAQDPATWLA